MVIDDARKLKEGDQILINGHYCEFVKLNENDEIWKCPALYYKNHPSMATGWHKIKSLK